MTAALQVEKLNRAFGALPVTRDVDLTLERGARRALIGPNGAGKTTLVNLITGVLKPHSGRILLNGEDITASSQAARARRGLARTFQINQLFRGLTVLENLCMTVGERDGHCDNLWRSAGSKREVIDEAIGYLEFPATDRRCAQARARAALWPSAARGNRDCARAKTAGTPP